MNNYIEWLNQSLNLLQNKCKKFDKHRSKTYTLNKILTENKLNVCLEFGVFNGVSINLISQHCNQVYGFDSFEGLPEDWSGVCKKEHFKVSNLPKVNENVILIKGWFKETLEDFLKENKNIEIDMIHIDCDLYSSTKDVFDILVKYNKIQPGLIIIFDELINYNKFYEGEIKALYELCNEHNINFEYLHTHGNVVSYKDILKSKYQNMTFKQFRNEGYQQEVAIQIL